MTKLTVPLLMALAESIPGFDHNPNLIPESIRNPKKASRKKKRSRKMQKNSRRKNR